MRSFTDLSVFGAYLQAKVADAHHAAQLGLHDAAEIVEHEAKARIGHYQDGWTELADRTKAERVKLGYSENDPLLRSGELRDAIGISLGENRAVVGVEHRTVGDGSKANPSRDIGDIACDQELGTPGAQRPIPPRPFLGPAAFAKGHEAVAAIAQAVGRSIAGLPYRRVRPGDKAGDIPF